MPGDYRNSLGFLNLQLRAGQLAQDQARQFQLEQQGREAQQQDIANTLSFMQHHEQAKSASEDRKLQLAAMLQKAAEANQTRKDVQELKDAAAKPERDSKVGKNEATTRHLDAQTGEIPKESARRDKTTTATISDVGTRHADRVRGQNMNLVGDLRRPGQFSGEPGVDIVPGGETFNLMSALGLAPAQGAAPGEINVGIQGRRDAVKKLDDAEEASADTRVLSDMVRKAPKEYFGPARAGVDVTVPKVIPFIGGKQINVGANTWEEMEANMGNLSPEEKKKVGERQAIKQAYAVRFQNLRHTLTGAAFGDRESREYAQQLTGMNDDPFSGDQELLAQALERAQAHADRRTQLLQHIAETGRRPKNASKMTNDELEAYLSGGANTQAPSGPQRRGGETGQTVDMSGNPADTVVQPDQKREKIKARVLEIMRDHPGMDQKAATAQALAGG